MLKAYHKLFRCPDDYSPVLFKENSLDCSSCGRHFPTYGENLIEILPSQFPDWNLGENECKSFEKTYRDFFNEKFIFTREKRGWGNLEGASAGYRAFVEEERKKIFELLEPSPNDTVLDVSGGAGNYSIPLANEVRMMVHCELQIDSVLDAYERSKEKHNMLVVRSPYLNLPFDSNSFDAVICTDTLIRGNNHENNLLAEIYRILKYKGRAVVDFHNHRFSNKKQQTRIAYYTKEEIERLFSGSKLNLASIYPFGYVPSSLVPCKGFYKVLNWLSGFFIPCMRYIAVITKESHEPESNRTPKEN